MALAQQTVDQKKEKPAGHGIIYRLVEFWWSDRRQVIAFFAFVLMYRVILMSWLLTAVLMASTRLHEWGHNIWFKRGKIASRIMYLFPAGEVAVPINQAENEKSDNLQWNHLAWLLQFGPLMNVVLIAVGVLMVRADAGKFLAEVGRGMILINMLLALGNLVPIWKLDAGQLFKLLFSSLDERGDKILFFVYSLLMLLLVILTMGSPLGEGWRQIVVAVLLNLKYQLVALFVVFSLWVGHKSDDPTLHDHENSTH